jgi:hypothetical protein
MSKNDIWYGILDAGEKTSPVVRDLTIQASNPNNVWLFNHSRNAFVEYSLAIVEPKLRELGKGDLSKDDLDKAFKAARKTFATARKLVKQEGKAPSAKPGRKKDAELDDDSIEDDDNDADEFIDDVDEGE